MLALTWQDIVVPVLVYVMLCLLQAAWANLVRLLNARSEHKRHEKTGAGGSVHVMAGAGMPGGSLFFRPGMASRPTRERTWWERLLGRQAPREAVLGGPDGCLEILTPEGATAYAYTPHTGHLTARGTGSFAVLADREVNRPLGGSGVLFLNVDTGCLEYWFAGHWRALPGVKQLHSVTASEEQDS